MNCPNCNANIPDASQFCPICGKATVQQVQPQQVFQPQQLQQQQVYQQPVQQQMVRQQPQPYNQYGAQQPAPQQYNYIPQQLMRCKNCKALLPFSATQCPNCSSTLFDRSPDLWLGILAVIFGAFVGVLSIPFGIVGLVSASKTKNKTLKTLSIIGLSLFGFWMLLAILINA